MKRVLALSLAVLLAGASNLAYAGGCPGAENDHLQPCCSTFTPPLGGSDEDRTCVGPATRYSFTVYSFSFIDSAGTVHSFGSPTVFDAAAVDAGQTAGTFVTGAVLPTGTYPTLRPEISHFFTVDANITTADGRHCVATGVSGNTDRELLPCNPTTLRPTNSSDNCLSNGNVLVYDSTSSLTYREGDPLNLGFAFYTQSAVQCTFPAGGSGDGTADVGELYVRINRN